MSISPNQSFPKATVFNKQQLLSYYQDIPLTNSQFDALVKIVDFLNSPTQIFILNGYAGTGKTFLLKGIVSYLSKLYIPVTLTAPTGKAVRVLENKLDIKAYTIYSFIYSKPQPTDEPIEKSNKRKFRMLSRLNDNQALPFNQILFIDESSLISNVYSDSDVFVFGSGKLLEDIFTFMELPAFPQRKIIFIGDNAQLPPIRMNVSPALNPEYLKQNFNYQSFFYQLTDVVRQKLDSSVLKNSLMLREQIENNHYQSLTFSCDLSCKKLQIDYLTAHYLAFGKAHGFSKEIIICASNKLAYNYNVLIRSKLFPDKQEIQEGDYIIITTNNHLYHLNNGDIVRVKKILQKRITVETTVWSYNHHIKKSTSSNVKFNFVDLIIEYLDHDKLASQSIRIYENLLYSEDASLSEIELQGLFQYTESRFNLLYPHKKRSNFATTEEFKAFKKARAEQRGAFFNNDLYLNSVKCKFAYAITCHKAQGSEWKRVYVDCQYFTNSLLNEQYFRWLYTAITRSKESLLLINHQDITVYTDFNRYKFI